MVSGLRVMKTFLSAQEGSGGGVTQNGEEVCLTLDVVRYLMTVTIPNRGSSLSVRNERELRTLAETLDCLLRGQIGSAGDILMQRFKAVEAASAPDGSWALSARYELIPPVGISAVPASEMEAALSLELRERKLQALLAAKRGGGRD